MIKKADNQLIRLLNERKILNIIRKEGPISKAALARRTHMSKVGAIDVINRLIQGGYVEEIGKGSSTVRGGKRPSLIKLNPNNHFVIGIDVRRREARIALANIEAEIIGKKRIEYPDEPEPEKVLDKIIKKIDGLLKFHSIDKNKLVSIGIGIPGLIDYYEGRLYFADTLKKWDILLLGKIFMERYGVPTILENDANTLALGESILGAGRDHASMVCILIGDGVGSGVIIDHKLVQGFSGSAGEVGYFEIFNGKLDNRQLKYLYQGQKLYGEFLSESLLHRVMLEKLNQEQSADENKTDLIALLALAEYHRGLQEILDEFAWVINSLCLAFIKVINPGIIILSGKVIENSTYLLERVRMLLAEKSRETSFIRSEIVVGELKEEAALHGAIAMALQVIFKSEDIPQYGF
jgi:predicted NBD/HSP70 family sugar kinase